ELYGPCGLAREAARAGATDSEAGHERREHDRRRACVAAEDARERTRPYGLVHECDDAGQEEDEVGLAHGLRTNSDTIVTGPARRDRARERSHRSRELSRGSETVTCPPWSTGHRSDCVRPRLARGDPRSRSRLPYRGFVGRDPARGGRMSFGG